MTLLLLILICVGLGFLYLFYQAIAGTPSEDALWGALAIVIIYQTLRLIPVDWQPISPWEPWIIPMTSISFLVIFARSNLSEFAE